MPARICSACDLRMPINIIGQCPVCAGPTKWHNTAEPDVNWRQRAIELKGQREGQALVSEDTGIPSATKEELPIQVDEDGRFWLGQGDLTRAGLMFSYLRSGYLVDIDGFLWELQGYQESRRRWWVEPVREIMGDIVKKILEAQDGD